MSRPRHPSARNRASGPYGISIFHAPAALAGLAMMGMLVLVTGGEQAWAASAPAVEATAGGLAQLLNGAEVRAVGLGQFPKWTGARGRSAIEGGAAWISGMAWRGDRDRRGQIEAVNRMVNRAPYLDDAVNYGLRDYWATPGELFTRGGDCEDYAFAKFKALRHLGFANRDLRLVVVHDIARGMPHAVLAVDLEAETLILDSQFNTIFAAALLKRYLPFYSVNEDGGWTHIAGWTTPKTITAQTITAQTDTAQTGTARTDMIKVNSTGSLAPAAARR